MTARPAKGTFPYFEHRTVAEVEAAYRSTGCYGCVGSCPHWSKCSKREMARQAALSGASASIPLRGEG